MTREQVFAKIQHFEHEVAAAIAESKRDHTEPEHVGILMWECDANAELQTYLDLLASMDLSEAA